MIKILLEIFNLETALEGIDSPLFDQKRKLRWGILLLDYKILLAY